MSREQIVYKKVSELQNNPNNPRKNDNAVSAVAKSIEKYGFRNPLIIDSNNVVWCGNTRLKASRELGLEEVPCIVVSDLTEKQIRELALLDNKTNEIAEWDFDMLKGELEDLDFGDFDIDWGIKDSNILDNYQNSTKGNLVLNYGIPPFSIFDTRKGYWIDRRNEWKSLGIKSELGRYEGLLSSSEVINTINNGTSIFDPVLCEIIYKWFCVDKGKICDCFAGGSVRGIVAEKLGYKYTGIDLREEQIDANKKNAFEMGLSPT